jgi:glutamyl/glutaminyl-tRNA synthetase
MEKKSHPENKSVFRAGVSPVDSNTKIGPIRSHLYTYAFAKSEAGKGRGGEIIFRVDDSDKEKHTKEKADQIYRFFADVLGLDFDITPENAQEKIGKSVFQSERDQIYKEAIEELFEKGVAFVDKESGLTLFDIEKFGEKYGGVVEIDDILRGPVKVFLEQKLRNGQKFFPLVRSDKSTLYHLASVVDDGEFGVTHVVRGQDKIPVAEFQEMVRVALDLEPKKYLHTPLLLNETGGLLSGKTKFADFIAEGILPHTLISYMVSSGYGGSDEIYPSLEAFIERFDYRKIHKSNGKFDPAKLRSINTKMVRTVTPEVLGISFEIYLEASGDKALLEAFRTNDELRNLIIDMRKEPKEAAEIGNTILFPIHEKPKEEQRSAIEKVLSSLEKEATILSATESAGLDKKVFFDALRWILTGRTTFSNIEHVFIYLKKQGILNERLKSAKNTLE